MAKLSHLINFIPEINLESSSMRSVFFVVVLFVALHAYAEQKTLTFPTATDGDVSVVMDMETRLPIGASDEKAKITFAGLTFLPKQPGDPLFWTWVYSIEFKPGMKVKSITIEDERDSEIKSLLRDEAPVIVSDQWRGQEVPHEVSRPFLDAMTSKDVWILLRRISIKYDDGSSSKLHQLIVEPPSARYRMLDRIMQARSKGRDEDSRAASEPAPK